MDPEIANNQQIPAPVPPVSQRKSKLPILLGIIILVLVSAGILLAKTGTISQLTAKPTPTLNPTENWKTYSNTTYGYSFQYPADWQYKERTNTVAAQEIWLGTKDQENLVTLYINKDKNLIMTKNDKLVTCSERGGKEITVGGIKAFSEYFPGGQNPAQNWICFEKGTRSYEFQHVYSTIIDSKTIFDQILSTFKFTDEKSSGEKVFCNSPRPEVCTMECIAQPSYVCGSNGKSYCSACQACANSGVDWYIIKNEPCEN